MASFSLSSSWRGRQDILLFVTSTPKSDGLVTAKPSSVFCACFESVSTLTMCPDSSMPSAAHRSSAVMSSPMGSSTSSCSSHSRAPASLSHSKGTSSSGSTIHCRLVQEVCPWTFPLGRSCLRMWGSSLTSSSLPFPFPSTFSRVFRVSMEGRILSFLVSSRVLLKLDIWR